MPNPIIKHITIPLPDGTTTTYDLSSISLTSTGSGNGVESVTLTGSELGVTYTDFLKSHPSVIKYTDTTSTSTPSFGDSFTAVDSVTRDTYGHVQKINLKTITLPTSSVTVDTALSTSSTNPVENRVVTNYKPGLVNQTTKGETFGASTSALGSYASAHGIGTSASGRYQMAIGQYNYEDTDDEFAFIIGNGAKTGVTTVYSNAFTVDWHGNTKMYGNAFVKGDYIHMGPNDEITLARYNLGTNTNIDKTNLFAMAPFPSFKYQNGANVGIVPIIGGIGTSQLTDGTGLIKVPWSRVYMRYGTTSQEGIAGLYLGNSQKAGVEDNAYGEMRIFTAGTAQTSSTSTSKPYIKILPPTLTGTVPNYTIYWPSRAGTLALEEYTVAGTYDANGSVTIPNVYEIQFTEWVPDMGMQAAGVLRGGGTGIGTAVFSLPNTPNGGTIALQSDIAGYHPSPTWTYSTTSTNLSFGGTFTIDRVNQATGDIDTYGHIAHGETITYKLPSLGGGTGISIGSNGYTINHSNSVTAQTDYNKYKYKYDAQGHITSSSYVVHTAHGTNGSAGWIKIASFKIIGNYFNTPVTLICSRRGDRRTFQISFGFANANSTDPDLKFFELSYIPSCVSTVDTEAYLIKSATSTWNLYVLKLDKYESFAVSDFIVGREDFSNYVTWTWKDEQTAESAITGGTAATNRMSLGMEYANNYYGMSAGTDDTQWIRTTTQGIIPYQSGGVNNGHSSLGTTSWRFKDAYIDEIYGTYYHGTSEYADKLNYDGGGQITPIYIVNGIPANCKRYASGATWNIVPVVQSDGTMEIGKYIDFHIANTGTTDYDIRLTADDTNVLSLSSYSGETALQVSGTRPRIKFNNTTSGKAYARNVLTGHASATYGMNLLLESGGNTIISSGESGTSFYELSSKSAGYPDYWSDDAEVLYLTSDTTVVILPNCNTIANRRAFTFGTNFGLPSGGRIRFLHSDESTASGLVNGANADTTSRTWTLPNETGTIALITQTDANALINTLSEGTSTPEDNDHYVSQYASGGTTTTTYHRRTMLALYKYLCNKRTGYVLPEGSSVSGSANNWFRIAYSTATGTYSDIEGIFVINYAHSAALCGILKVRGRIEGTAGTFGNTKSVQWLVKDDGLDGNNICVIFANNKGSGSATVSGTACVEIWVKATQRYDTITCTMLNGFGRNALTNTDWTWYMEINPGATGTSTLPTYSSSTAIYATTEMGITAYDVTYKTPTPSGKVDSEWYTTAERTRLVTKGWMSYWDGSYDGSASNLTYCSKGAFGTIVTHAAGDFVLKTGDTMSGALSSSLVSSTYLAGNKGTSVINSTAGSGSYVTLIKSNSTNGKFTIASYQNNLRFQYTSNTTINNNTNSCDKTTIFYEDGSWSFPSTIDTAGNITISKSSSTDTYYVAKRTDTNVSVGMGVGSGGTNHGLYSHKLSKWLVNGDGSNVYINNHKVPTLSGAGVGVFKDLYSSASAPTATSGNVTVLSATSKYIYDEYDMVKVWIYIGSTSMIQQLDICCITKALAQAPHYFPTAASYNTKYVYFTFSASGSTYTSKLNWTTSGTSDSTKISIARVIGIKFR